MAMKSPRPELRCKYRVPSKVWRKASKSNHLTSFTEIVKVLRSKADNLSMKSESGEFSATEALALFCSVLCVQALEIWRAGAYLNRAQEWLDNDSYITIASIIRSGRFKAPYELQHFLGFPLLIEGVSQLLRISEMGSLLMLSLACSLLACFLICRLFGPATAIVFCILNIDWVRLSIMGGSEPLFACFLFGSFMAVRSERWILAASLASLASMVRPVGAIALVAFAAGLLWQRRWAKLAGVVIIGSILAGLYGALTSHFFGDPLVSVRLYSSDWGRGRPISFPLLILFASAFNNIHAVPWTEGLYSTMWIVLTLGFTVVTLFAGKWRQLLNIDPAEMIFASLYLAFFLMYNYEGIAGCFPRFMIPILPMGLFCVRSWIPQNRQIVWPAAILSALFAAAGIVGFKTVFGFALH
jgi:hypothetical protein